MKVLYFEGAGMASADDSIKSGVGNCRIRTAFRLDNGKPVYVEISGRFANKGIEREKAFSYVGYVTSCYYAIVKETDTDLDKYSLLAKRESCCIEYSTKGILNFINSLGASFDAIQVLPNIAGYRVFGKKYGEYNYGDEFQPNWKVVETGKKIKSYYDSLSKQGEGYFSIWNDDDDLTKIRVRSFNTGKQVMYDGLAEDWQATK